METPFALIVFIVFVLLIALLVYFSRRRADSTPSGSGSAAPTSPAKSRSPKLTETGSYQPAPKDDADQFFGKQERPSGAKPSAPPPPANSPAPAAPPPAPPPAQAAPAKPAPTRSARGLFDEESDDQVLMGGVRDKRDDEKKKAEPPLPREIAPEPEPVAPGAAPEDKPEGKLEAPAIPAEDVRFTAYHAKEADVETWYTLLVYAHIEAALAKVQADAAKYKAEMGDTPRESRSSAGAQLMRGTELTVVPQMEGVEFNPERISFKWVEDMHRAEFRMKAGKDLAGLAGNGTISIFVGPLIVATIRFGMLFNEKSASVPTRVPMSTNPTTTAPLASETATLYKADQIFVSYSHKDSPVVLACRDAYKALGYDVLLDVDTLRSGEKWNDALMRMIDRADIFQLFWSKNSADSKYCRQEWEYALKKSKEGFIRPVYWEQPLVSPPNELDELHFAYVPLAKNK